MRSHPPKQRYSHQPAQRPAPAARIPSPNRPLPVPAASGARRLPPRSKPAPKTNWLLIAGVGAAAFVMMSAALLMLGAVFIFAGERALPGVHVLDVPVGSRSVSEIAAAVPENATLRLRDGQRIFPVTMAELGIVIDREATARAAAAFARSGDFNLLARAVIGRADMPPVISIDRDGAAQALQALASQIDLLPVNAGVRLVDGVVVAREAQDGRALDIEGTLAQLTPEALADGEIELAMFVVPPAVRDAEGLVALAQALLISPLTISAYDPILNQTTPIAIPPERWGEWITSTPDNNAGMTLAIGLDGTQLTQYLQTEVTALGADRYLEPGDVVTAAQSALAQGQTTLNARVFHRDTQYVVQPGDSIISIAYNYGIPYPYLQQANPGVNELYPGQTITLPSRDIMLPEPVVFSKRIVVSIREQRVRVYENNQLIWDWIASTGISSSPTWPGVYQILSHEPNAYAGNWNLWMPNFMGVYRPIPGADFTNGFHGFPTRGGSQLLWTNSLGTRVTYGCILLSDTNIRLLYDWADVGTVVEITA